MKKFAWTLIFLIVFSVYSWIGYQLTHAELPSTASPSLLYATETHDDLQLILAQAINEAKKSIRLTIYSLRDKKIINALKRATKRGVDVQVICDRNASSGVAKKLGEKILTRYRKSKGLMHQKILIIDNTLIFCGSANLTTASLKMHGNLINGIKSKELADHLTLKFKNLNIEGLVEPMQTATYQLNEQKLEMWLFPDQNDGVERIQNLLRSAKKKIKIAMFTWTRHDLADAVISAHLRGIDVEVALDRNASNGVSKRIAEKLTKAGINVWVNQGQELLHHKFLLVDDSTLLNGSANWTKAAFTNNDDCFMILSPLNTKQQKMLLKMWKEILNHSAQLYQPL